MNCTRSMRKYILKILYLFFPVLIFANDPENTFQEANELYLANEFSTAIEKYESILDQGFRSSELYYNLGNAYYKVNMPGKAVLNYERALKLATAESRKDIEHNLAVIRKNSPDEIEALPQFFLKRWKNNLQYLLSSKSWSITAMIFFWLGMGGLMLWLAGRSRQQKKTGFIFGLLLITISLLPFYMAFDRKKQESNSGLAVIMAAEVNLRSAPDESSAAVLLLHEGTSVDLTDQIGEWYKVELQNGEQGWLPKRKLEKI